MLERKTSSNGVVFYSSPLLSQIGVPHGVSTRLGGVSEGIFSSMNLGNPLATEFRDQPENIDENYRRLQEAIGVAGRERVWVHQVHGGGALCASPATVFKNGEPADAIVCDDPARVASIRVADCTPILIASDDGAVVAAIHAGWRGVIAGVALRALDEMKKRTRRDFAVAIGPCIAQCNFEVGPEVVQQFRGQFGAEAPVEVGPNGKGYVDMPRALAIQFRSAGIDESRVDFTDRCTFRDKDEFFSHRRDKGMTGRMAALIGARRK